MGQVVPDRDTSVPRALATLSQANRVLVRATAEGALLQQMCTTIADTGGYLLCWYGRPVDDDVRSVQPVARAGTRQDYVDDIRISWDDGPLGQGPTGRCIRTRQTQVVNDFAPDSTYGPWQTAAAQRGFSCSICLPVIVGDDLDGVLMVYAAEVGSFGSMATSLLEDLAADLGYGLSRLRDMADLERSTQESQDHRDRMHATIDSLIDPFILLEAVRDADGRLVDLRYLEANEAALAYNRISREDLIGACMFDLFPGQVADGTAAKYLHTVDTGEPTVLDDYAYGNERVGEERRYDIRAIRSGDGIALTWRDVTERSAAAQRLADSERMFRVLSENSSDVVLLVDSTLTARWVSPSVRATFGFDPSEIVGRGPGDFIHPDDLPAALVRSRSSDSGAEPARMRYRRRCADGAYKWVDATATRVLDIGDGEAGRVVQLRDVDDQVRAETALAQREERFRLLAENSSDVVVLRDEQLRILWASPSTAMVLGVDAAAAVGMSVTEFVDPDDVSAMIEEIEAARASGTGASNYRLRLRTGSGDYRWFAGRNRPVSTGPGQPRHWVVSMQDIDEQVHAETELADSERLFRTLAENSSDVVILTDENLTVKWASPSALPTFGLDPEILVGRSPADFVHPDDLAIAPEAMARGIQTGSAVGLRYRWRHGDSGYRWAEVSGRHVTDTGAGGSGWVLQLRDIDDEVTAQLRLAISEERFRLLAENASDVVVLRDEQLDILWASPSMSTVMGIDADAAVGMSVTEFVHPDDLLVAEAQIEAAKASGVGSPAYRLRLRTGSGEYRWFEGRNRPITTGPGEARHWVVSLQDVEDKVRGEHEVAESERMYRLLAENVSDIVLQVNPDGSIAWASASTKKMLGRKPDDLVGTPAVDLIHPDDVEAAFARRAAVLAGATGEREFRVLRDDGTVLWMAIDVRPIATADGVGRVVAARDISDRVTSRNALEYVLEHDQLTGLPSRRALTELLDSRLTQLRSGAALAVIYIDVDGLSAINEGLGQGAGDVVLVAVADRIAECVVDEHFLARGSGDEFAIVLPSLSSGDEAAAVAEHVLAAVRPVVDYEGHEITPTVSIGIAIATRTGDGRQVLKDAALGARQAKGAGGDCQVFADPALALVAEHRVSLEADIRSGLRASAFTPWFQPIMSFDTGELAGYEALARWVRPGGVIEPGGFMDIAEGCSLILDLDLTILQQAVRALSQLPEHLFVSVNVTAATLTRTPYPALVATALAESGIVASRLRLEITETTLLARAESTAGIMREIADLGVRWYVDDFGTGYSSISHLRDLPIAGLKLDRSFTAGIGDGERTAMRLADALIGLARGLGLETVAEGVETDAEADYLRTLGWKYGQGWLYGKAAPLA